jgi:RimJ/RimL family protein N-acetyltransferase
MYPLTSDHLALEAQLHVNSEIMHYVGGSARSMAEVEEAHARRVALSARVDGLGYWMAYVRGHSGHDDVEISVETVGDFVGLLMLPPAHGPDQPDDPGVADLGYRLARPAWGHGYGREAAIRLLEHGFATVGLERVIAQTRSDNVRSRRLLEIAGMRYVRTFRSLDDQSDGPLDVEYELRNSEWRRGVRDQD